MDTFDKPLMKGKERINVQIAKFLRKDKEKNCKKPVGKCCKCTSCCVIVDCIIMYI